MLRGYCCRLVARLAMTSFVCALAGCEVVTHPYGFDVGVELEPLASGWHDNLRVRPVMTPGQFTWRDGQFSAEIVNWTRDDPTYFMVYMRNLGTEGARVRVHHVSAGDLSLGLGRYEISGPGGYRRWAKEVDEREWIELPASGHFELWIDHLDWLDNPSVDDRISFVIDIDAGTSIVTCPVVFRVARVFRWQ